MFYFVSFFCIFCILFGFNNFILLLFMIVLLLSCKSMLSLCPTSISPFLYFFNLYFFNRTILCSRSSTLPLLFFYHTVVVMQVSALQLQVFHLSFFVWHTVVVLLIFSSYTQRYHFLFNVWYTPKILLFQSWV